VAVREFGFDGVTINGLVVGGNVERLRRYYEDHVIHGPGAFVEVALDFDTFAEAMRRKLIRELGPVASVDEDLIPVRHGAD
jgi:Ca-activated chloride channel homolog